MTTQTQKPYLYHTIITDLVTGEIRHYFGKHNGKNPKYKGSGSCIAKATSANKRLRSKQQPPRFLLEHIIVQEFETMKECSENEKYLIATGNEQFGASCKNVRTEDSPENPFMYFDEYQEQVSKNKSAAVKARWADPVLKARRLERNLRAALDKMLAKLPEYTEHDIREIAKLMSESQFVSWLQKRKVPSGGIGALEFGKPIVRYFGYRYTFDELRELWNSGENILEKGALGKPIRNTRPEKERYTDEQLEAYKNGADTYYKMWKAIGTDQGPEYFRSAVKNIQIDLGIFEEVQKSKPKNRKLGTEDKKQLLEIWKQNPCYAPEFKKKAIVLGYPDANYKPIIAEFAESTGIKLAISPVGTKFTGEIGAKFDSLKALWLENRLSYHKFRAVAVANGYENRSYQGFVQHMMMHY